MPPNISDLYGVLRAWAVARRVGSYTELSREYEIRTGDRFEPHGNWDGPLGELNRRLHAAGVPALSALVVLNEKQEPGDRFWGCALNVPARPKNEGVRLAEWARIVQTFMTTTGPRPSLEGLSGEQARKVNQAIAFQCSLRGQHGLRIPQLIARPSASSRSSLPRKEALPARPDW